MTFPTNEDGGWIVPARTVLPEYTIIPSYSKLGNECRLGNGCALGTGCTLGNEYTIDSITNARLFCMSNLDGSGRQIIIIHGDGQTIIRAGCFRGSVDEFCAKADGEGKAVYVAVVRAAAAAFVGALS